MPHPAGVMGWYRNTSISQTLSNWTLQLGTAQLLDDNTAARYVSTTEIPEHPKKTPMQVITKYKDIFNIKDINIKVIPSDLQDTELLEIMD